MLLDSHRSWLRGRRVGLVGHEAALDSHGVGSAERLVGEPGVDLVALFGPEHGFAGLAGAGEDVSTFLHPTWHIPVHSLYGDTRRPTAEMMAEVDVIVCDLRMPRLDGKDFYAWVLENRPDMADRIVFVTGDAFDPDTQAFLKQSGARSLAKPFEMDDFERAVAEVLRSSAEANPS